MIGTIQSCRSSSRSAPRRASLAVILAALAAPALLVGFPAPAQAETPGPQGSVERERWFGFGTALGVGVMAGARDGRSTRLPGRAFLLPTLELQGFPNREYSINVTVPMFNMSMAGGFSTDAFFNFNFGRGSMRSVAGQGIGFAVAPSRPRTPAKTDELRVSAWQEGWGLRIPAELGVEFLSHRRDFGFKFLMRPTLEIGFIGGAHLNGAGVLWLAAFSIYIAGRRTPPRASVMEESRSGHDRPTWRSRPGLAAFPEEVAGFTFGSSSNAAQQACVDAGSTWEQEARGFVCAAPMKPAGFVFSVRLEMCDDEVCSVELVARPQKHHASSRFNEMRSELEDQYGPPSSQTTHLSRECRTSIAQCVLDGTAVVRAQWQRPGGSISLEMDKLDESVIVRVRYEQAAADEGVSE